MFKIAATTALVAAAFFGPADAAVDAVLRKDVKSGGLFSGCYKNTTTRGVGKVISACAPGLEKDALLCYPPCKKGFKGVGPVCWEECPSNTVDTGAFCNERLVGGDNSDCKWYDKCGLTFDKGCVKCPSGFTSRGCLCSSGSTFAKKSYGRGAGVPLGCPVGQVEDAALCYPPCPAATKGLGPVCWGQCTPNHPYSCGAMCLADSSACANKVKTVAFDILDLTKDLAICAGGGAPGCNKTGIADALLSLTGEFFMLKCPW